ncbi:hypothetical protein KEM48_009555 [Puccinia striiformis f. sp. tritici PST-130]|nr:hypothetical protein KEM48_009555 [Puccinia striiformis f. sp. tritici PST-130]
MVPKLNSRTVLSLFDLACHCNCCITGLSADGKCEITNSSDAISNPIAAHGFTHELTNYGDQNSGATTKGQTFEYARTILDLTTHGETDPEGNDLIIGGGITKSTNLAATFSGTINALRNYNRGLQHREAKNFCLPRWTQLPKRIGTENVPNQCNHWY